MYCLRKFRCLASSYSYSNLVGAVFLVLDYPDKLLFRFVSVTNYTLSILSSYSTIRIFSLTIIVGLSELCVGMWQSKDCNLSSILVYFSRIISLLLSLIWGLKPPASPKSSYIIDLRFYSINFYAIMCWLTNLSSSFSWDLSLERDILFWIYSETLFL